MIKNFLSIIVFVALVVVTAGCPEPNPTRYTVTLESIWGGQYVGYFETSNGITQVTGRTTQIEGGLGSTVTYRGAGLNIDVQFQLDNLTIPAFPLEYGALLNKKIGGTNASMPVGQLSVYIPVDGIGTCIEDHITVWGHIKDLRDRDGNLFFSQTTTQNGARYIVVHNVEFAYNECADSGIISICYIGATDCAKEDGTIHEFLSGMISYSNRGGLFPFAMALEETSTLPTIYDLELIYMLRNILPPTATISNTMITY